MIGKIVIRMIKFYQKYISPLGTPKCRFHPTCSEYGIQAIEKYGILKGGFMLMFRILKCNPFGPHGYDPVN